MTQKFISILTLVYYTQINGFENLLHLLLMLPDYSKLLLNELYTIGKASNIQNQYLLANKIRLINPNYGDTRMEVVQLREREEAIEQKVENIIAIDIALLKFIETVPERIEKNSFQLPQNADVPYLMSEHLTMKENDLIKIISGAFQIFENAKFTEQYQEAPKLDKVIFNNQRFLTRTQKSQLRELSDNQELEYDYRSTLDFLNQFFENSSNRSIAEIRSSNLPRSLGISLDLRQTLYAMASMFSLDDEMHRKISNFFNTVDPSIDQEQNLKAKKPLLSNMTRRNSAIYANKVLMLILYFIFVEENNDLNDSTEGLASNVQQYRNQLVLILNRIIEHYLEYIQYKTTTVELKKIFYAKLPLLDIPKLDSKRRPITYLIYILQYALTFAPFLSSAL